MSKKAGALLLSILLGISATGCGNKKPPDSSGSDADPTVYLVQFVGESVTVPFQQIEAGKTATKPSDPERAGYEFIGWYLGAEEYDFAAPVNGDLTLTGKWRDKQQGGNTEVNPPEPQIKTVEMLRDRTYANGFRLTSAGSGSTEGTYLGPVAFDPAKTNWQWTLAQWGIKQENLIRPNAEIQQKEGKYWFTTASQKVGVDTQKGEVYMEQNTSLEYDEPRKNGEAWPHMLIEQSFHFDWNNPRGNNQAVRFDGIEALRLSMDFTVHKAEKKMTYGYNAELHAAQFQWYCTMHNVNPDSPDYMNCIWFGFQFYDNRNPRPGGTIQVDGGKDDASGLAIVVPYHRDILEEPVQIGVPSHVEIDMLPLVRTWLEKVKKFTGVKVFQNTVVGDLAMTSMNLGWELPGTFDVQSTLKNLSIEYDVKEG